jgi:hypothetical protein
MSEKRLQRKRWPEKVLILLRSNIINDKVVYKVAAEDLEYTDVKDHTK